MKKRKIKRDLASNKRKSLIQLNLMTFVRGEIKAFKMGVLRFNSFGEITVQSRNHLSILGALFINTLGEISIAIRMK